MPIATTTAPISPASGSPDRLVAVIGEGQDGEHQNRGADGLIQQAGGGAGARKVGNVANTPAVFSNPDPWRERPATIPEHQKAAAKNPPATSGRRYTELSCATEKPVDGQR